MIIRFFICCITAALMWSCTNGDETGGVDYAVDRFEAGNYAGSREIVARLTADTTALDTMPVGELCRLAALCLRLDSVAAPCADNPGEALAAKCLVAARRQNPDSVEAFLRSLPRETAQSLSVIDRVATYLTIPRDSLVVEGDTLQ